MKKIPPICKQTKEIEINENPILIQLIKISKIFFLFFFSFYIKRPITKIHLEQKLLLLIPNQLINCNPSKTQLKIIKNFR